VSAEVSATCFQKLRGSKGKLNKWGVLLPGAPNRASLESRQR